MIKKLRLVNFRGFVDHTVFFSPFTLLTGRNNAGKTTIIEALRIISVAQSKVATANFLMAPAEFDKHFTGPVFRFTLTTIEFDEGNIHHNYRVEDPASLHLTLSNNCKISIYLGRDSADKYCQLQRARGSKVNKRLGNSDRAFHQVYVMPPVGSLLVSETERNKRYLRKNINGYLSYRHIRNQMAEMDAEFAVFRKELERTWDGLRVKSLELAQNEDGSVYELMIRDGRYPAEVARLGSGLQAWIQTLWFLSRVGPSSIIVLDEPDVYLHADLQKKLIRLLGASDYRQKIVATHSIEMISDVSPDEIVEVKRGESTSKVISSTKEVQAVLNQMGTSHHLQLSKLGQAGKVLFVEGKDHKLLSQLAMKLGKSAIGKFEAMPRFEIGGMGNWQRAALTSKVLADTSSGALECILIMDRDYFDEKYLDNIVEQAKDFSLTVLFWDRKEIENYFIDIETIWQFIQKNCQKKVDRFYIEEQIDEFVRSMLIDLPGQIAQNLQLDNKKLAVPTVLKKANTYIQSRKNDGFSEIDLVSGKKLFSKISEFAQREFGVSFSATTICREMPLSRVPKTIRQTLEKIVG